MSIEGKLHGALKGIGVGNIRQKGGADGENNKAEEASVATENAENIKGRVGEALAALTGAMQEPIEDTMSKTKITRLVLQLLFLMVVTSIITTIFGINVLPFLIVSSCIGVFIIIVGKLKSTVTYFREFIKLIGKNRFRTRMDYISLFITLLLIYIIIHQLWIIVSWTKPTDKFCESTIKDTCKFLATYEPS